ncbi:hypothetical protein DAMA08_027630 [Martiniozyma asiatica (nom. inval.)]|nr:hypothetical protein DAMA08_027630 [Martiniozyma asiatica]
MIYTKQLNNDITIQVQIPEWPIRLGKSLALKINFLKSNLHSNEDNLSTATATTTAVTANSNGSSSPWSRLSTQISRSLFQSSQSLLNNSSTASADPMLGYTHLLSYYTFNRSVIDCEKFDPLVKQSTINDKLYGIDLSKKSSLHKFYNQDLVSTNDGGDSGESIGDDKLNNDDDSERIVPYWSTRQELLFTDIKYNFEYSVKIELPDDLPDTFNSWLFNVMYVLVIGYQILDPNKGLNNQMIMVPLNLFGGTGKASFDCRMNEITHSKTVTGKSKSQFLKLLKELDKIPIEQINQLEKKFDEKFSETQDFDHEDSDGIELETEYELAQKKFSIRQAENLISTLTLNKGKYKRGDIINLNLNLNENVNENENENASANDDEDGDCTGIEVQLVKQLTVTDESLLKKDDYGNFNEKLSDNSYEIVLFEKLASLFNTEDFNCKILIPQQTESQFDYGWMKLSYSLDVKFCVASGSKKMVKIFTDHDGNTLLRAKDYISGGTNFTVRIPIVVL